MVNTLAYYNTKLIMVVLFCFIERLQVALLSLTHLTSHKKVLHLGRLLLACKYQTRVEMSVSREHYSLFRYQINSSRKRFCFIAKVPGVIFILQSKCGVKILVLE